MDRTKKVMRPRDRQSMSFDKTDIERAHALADLLVELPEYRNLKLKGRDIMRMACGMGLDGLERMVKVRNAPPAELAVNPTAAE